MPLTSNGKLDQATITVRQKTGDSFRLSARKLGLTMDEFMGRLLEEGLDGVRERRVTEIQEGGGA